MLARPLSLRPRHSTCCRKATVQSRTSSGVCGLNYQRAPRRSVCAQAEKNSATDTQTSAVAYLEAAVPKDQRPSNELTQLKGDLLYSWGSLELSEYIKRLAGVFAFFVAMVGGPIAYQTFSPTDQPIEWALSASVGSLVVVTIVVVRIYLGWAYVSDRLLSATYAYEETGWYDGQTFVKPPEVLTRDRLLGMYETKPVLQKLRGTLVGTGATLLACAVLLFGLIQTGSDADGMYGRGAGPPARRVTADGLIFSAKVTDLRQLADDDELAAEEAAAMGGMPGYCRDRMLRAAAGGNGCAKFDL